MRNNAIYKLGVAISVFCSLAVALTGCGGGGGGGGGGGNPTGSASVTAIVLTVEDNTPPTSATVKIGGQTTTTDANGKFTLGNLPTSVSGSIAASGEQTLPVNLKLKVGVNDLGTIYVSSAGYTASVTGRVVSSTTAGITPVTGATVTIGTQSTLSATDGTFTLNSLPIGLGAVDSNVGLVTAAGFDNKIINAETLGFALVTGANPIGDVLIAQPSGSTPGAPYTLKGVVRASGSPAANVSVALQSNGVTLGSTTTDSTGSYFFWVVPATYTVTAATGTTSLSTTVTLSRLDTPVTAPTIVFP